MDIDLLTMSISALAVAISVYVAVPYSEKKYTPIDRTARDQPSPELQRLIGNVDELERIAKIELPILIYRVRNITSN